MDDADTSMLRLLFFSLLFSEYIYIHESSSKKDPNPKLDYLQGTFSQTKIEKKKEEKISSAGYFIAKEVRLNGDFEHASGQREG